MPEAAIAPAPTPKPPAPTPTPTPSPTPPSGDDPFAAADAKATLPPKETKKPEPEPKPGERAPEKPAAKPADDKVKAVVKEPKELRAELDRLRNELKTRDSKISEWEGKYTGAEQKVKDVESLTATNTDLKKQLDAARAENRMLKRETSPDFQEKYEKPFNTAAEYTRDLVKRLNVTTQTEKDGETFTSQRAATWEDFAGIYRLPLNDAIERAEQMFGRAAQPVVNQIVRLKELEFQRDTAKAEEMKNWETKSKEEEGQRVAQQERFTAAFSAVTKELAEKNEFYKDDPEDKELASLREEGYQLFDSKPQTPNQVVIKGAHIRHRVAAFNPMKMQILRLRQERDDLKAELDGLKPRNPGDTKRGGSTEAPKTNKSWEDQLREDMKNVR